MKRLLLVLAIVLSFSAPVCAQQVNPVHPNPNAQLEALRTAAAGLGPKATVEVIMDQTGFIGATPTIILEFPYTQNELFVPRNMHKIDAVVLGCARELASNNPPSSFQVAASFKGTGYPAACTYIHHLDEMHCRDKEGPFH